MNESANWEAVAWFLAAEGSIQLNKNKYTNCLAPQVNIEITEPEMLETFIDIIDIGQIAIREKKNKNHKTTYIWCIYSKKEIQEFLKRVLPFMPSLRKAKIGKLLLEFYKLRENNWHYTSHEWEIYKQVKELNRKGGKGRRYG